MAEKKGVGHAYNVDFLNVVFAASSLFLFLSVVWMVWDDFNREWKNTQRRFVQLENQVTQAQLQQAGRNVDRSKLQQLEGLRGAVLRARISQLAARHRGVARAATQAFGAAEFALFVSLFFLQVWLAPHTDGDPWGDLRSLWRPGDQQPQSRE